METDLNKNFKKWVWNFLLGQLFIMLVSGGIFYGSVQTTLKTHGEDIEYLKKIKADLQTVLRIKVDSDIKDQMILDQLKEINENQRMMYDLLVSHMNKENK
jgi:hypothetical protein